MNVNINVYDVASEEEVKQAALDVIRHEVFKTFNKENDLDRLISNLSYEFVFNMVNEQFNGNLENLLKEKITEILNDLSSYTVFRRKDAWDRDESIATKILNEECANARPLIKQRVEQIIEQYPFNELKNDEIGEVVYECIMDRLFNKNTINE